MGTKFSSGSHGRRVSNGRREEVEALNPLRAVERRRCSQFRPVGANYENRGRSVPRPFQYAQRVPGVTGVHGETVA